MDFFQGNSFAIFIFATVMIFIPRNAEGRNFANPQQQSDGVRVTRVSQELHNLGEGPHWDECTQKLYYVDSFVGDVCRLDPETGVTETVHLGGTTGFVIPYQSDPSKLLVTVTRQVRKVDFDSGQSEVLAELPPGPSTLRFNDGKCDAKGRAFGGTFVLNQTGQGNLYRIDPGYTLTSVADDITLSNGLVWSLDNKKLYFVDSVPRYIYSFDYNLLDGTASNKQVLISYNESSVYDGLGIPDGMTIDIDGKLWVAHFGGGCLLHIDPETRRVLRKIDIPAKSVTSCAFGGPQFDILYVTTAKKDSLPSQIHAGAVFAVTGLGTRGLPPNDFAEPQEEDCID